MPKSSFNPSKDSKRVRRAFGPTSIAPAPTLVTGETGFEVKNLYQMKAEPASAATISSIEMVDLKFPLIFSEDKLRLLKQNRKNYPCPPKKIFWKRQSAANSFPAFQGSP